jgi:hypothetical protein
MQRNYEVAYSSLGLHCAVDLSLSSWVLSSILRRGSRAYGSYLVVPTWWQDTSYGRRRKTEYIAEYLGMVQDRKLTIRSRTFIGLL